MKLDDFQKSWQSQDAAKEISINADVLLNEVRRNQQQFRRTIFWRDVREVGVAMLLVPVFIYSGWKTHWTLYLSAFACFVVGAFLVLDRRRQKKMTPDLHGSLKDCATTSLAEVSHQIWLLKNILWWYLLPPFVPMLLFFGWCAWSPSGAVVAGILQFLFLVGIVLLINVFVYWLNQSAVKKCLEPRRRELEALLHWAETGEPLDETHVAKLRSMALSIAAADQVKPVEFKVAFGQIAFFGMPGIVGIWFFLMLGLTMSNQDWKTKEPARETIAPTFHVEETNRYSVVARTVVGQLNAGDYAAVQKLFTPEMSNALPPETASDFFTGLATGFGHIETVEGPTGNGYRGWTAFRLDCQHGELTMSLALNAEDRIAGLYFKPAHRHYANFKSFMLELFNWRHLLWLPPFVMAGLLYSWLLQKLTKRAVGISALGIHLSKGLNLILWDEIQEVRPLRFLHVRNLWLTSESGEKTLMHWTPLERHADLKAAVERCAPANHPIRKYLSLLT